MIKFENVSKRYTDGTTAVDSVNLEIKQGEFFVIIGPSGCGKTTTLKMVNRLIPLSDGTIFINGKKISEFDIHELRWNIGYVLQQIALFPHMTIEENISIVPELKKWSREKTKLRVIELLDMVGLDPKTYLNRKPIELSGGQQQRIGVIRALAADPEIILMDEPFSALDPISREKLQDDIKKLQKNIKKTTIFVTHDIQEALKLADRICVMKDGKVVQVGTPNEIVSNPANHFVRDFVGNQHVGLKAVLKLEEIVQPIHEGDISQTLSCMIPVSTSLEEILEKLTEHEELAVDKNGEIIGILNRQVVIKYLAQNLQERGSANG
ncbi:ABC transporter ATP-binding protein [Neobacillus sp. FSL H8-0543]|uniref:ABC transporter ATP-binding protein n=1 Tax=Neobacillus sp. FSL H8-0543 TaxID=2954672 RepID=UPI003158C396